MKFRSRVFDIAAGPVLATVFLIYPGVFAFMWEFGFLAGISKYHFVLNSAMLGLFAMALAFPIGVAGTLILWRVAPKKDVSSFTIHEKRFMIAVLCMALAEALWVLMDLPGFNHGGPRLQISIYLALIGPMYVGTKSIYRLWRC